MTRDSQDMDAAFFMLCVVDLLSWVISHKPVIHLASGLEHTAMFYLTAARNLTPPPD